jgi:hypothetical protein
MNINKKCVISRYDETIKESPFLTIPIDSVEVYQPKIDHLGEELYERLRGACRSKGYVFKFYTLSEDKNFDYEIVVY